MCPRRVLARDAHTNVPSQTGQTINDLPSGLVIGQIGAPAPLEHKVMQAPRTGRPALRRHYGFLEITVAACLISARFFCVLGGPPAPVMAQDAGIALDELMAGEALPDVALGANKAPVTIVEYASMTCTHCAGFYATTF